MKMFAGFLIAFLVCGCASSPESYPDPYEVFIDVSGTIDDAANCIIRVEYVTRGETRQCRNYNWLAGVTAPRTAEFDYSPEIESGRHAIRIPLYEISSRSFCGWAASTVYLCMAQAEIESTPRACSSLFFIRDGAPDPPQPIELVCAGNSYCTGPEGVRTETVSGSKQMLTVNLRARDRRSRPWRRIRLSSPRRSFAASMADRSPG